MSRLSAGGGVWFRVAGPEVGDPSAGGRACRRPISGTGGDSTATGICSAGREKGTHEITHGHWSYMSITRYLERLEMSRKCRFSLISLAADDSWWSFVISVKTLGCLTRVSLGGTFPLLPSVLKYLKTVATPNLHTSPGNNFAHRDKKIRSEIMIGQP